MYYTLYNKKFMCYLTHPQIGLWSTSDFEEAEEMLAACVEFARSFNIPGYEQQFIIVDAENHEELWRLPQQARD